MNKKSPPAVAGLRLLQALQVYFCEINGVKNTPKLVVQYLFDELSALARAVGTDDRPRIRTELADLLIAAANLANCLGRMRLDQIVGRRLEDNFRKCDPFLAKKLDTQRLTVIDAFKKMHTEYGDDD